MHGGGHYGLVKTHFRSSLQATVTEVNWTNLTRKRKFAKTNHFVREVGVAKSGPKCKGKREFDRNFTDFYTTSDVNVNIFVS